MRLNSIIDWDLANASGSEEMSLVQLYIPSEVSHDTISELAEMGNFQFKDVSRLFSVS
jgi:V-type H+-transporting ATPase subunit a